MVVVDGEGQAGVGARFEDNTQVLRRLPVLHQVTVFSVKCLNFFSR